VTSAAARLTYDERLSIAADGAAHSRVRLGRLWASRIDFNGALHAIDLLVSAGRGGAVFTPNVDHLVKAERNPAFCEAYAQANLSLADGMPLVWLARILGRPLPERVAGSDLTRPLMQLASRRAWRVYLLGGGAGVAERAARHLREDLGVNVVGWDSPSIRADGTDVSSADSVAAAAAAKPDVILIALGAPKQELWFARARVRIPGAVGFGLGGSLDFLIGRYKKAPAWIAAAGLEWLFRLLQEPTRLWRRYLVEGPRFLGIAWRTWRARSDSFSNEL